MSDQTLTSTTNSQPLDINQKEEEQKNNVQPSNNASTIEEYKTPKENKKEKRRTKKRTFKKIFTVTQELQHEWKRTFKISYTDNTLNIKSFQRQITNEKLKEFLSVLQKRLEENNITLTRLSLNLGKSRYLTDEAVDYLIAHLGTTFKNLEYLDLNLKECTKITDEPMIQIINHIGLHLQHLKHLNLNLYAYPYRENNRTEAIVENLLPNLPNLRTFNINSPLNYFSKEKDILEYFRAITNNLPLLENLTVDIRSSKISEQAFTEIAEEIAGKLPHLKHLYLNFNNLHELSDKSLINFFRVIAPGFKQLETLELHLRNRRLNNITDQVLESLANRFSDHFQTLKSLVLNFEGSSKITTEGVSKFVKSIGTNLKNLKNLDLNFNGLWNLSDEIMESFAFLNNQHLKELEALKLAIAGTKITDQGLKDLLAAFQGKSENLKELSLDFSGVKQISETGIRYLGTHIPQTFKNLKSLKLILRNHKQIMTPKMKAFLAKSFKAIRKYEITLGQLY